MATRKTGCYHPNACGSAVCAPQILSVPCEQTSTSRRAIDSSIESEARDGRIDRPSAKSRIAGALSKWWEKRHPNHRSRHDSGTVEFGRPRVALPSVSSQQTGKINKTNSTRQTAMSTSTTCARRTICMGMPFNVCVSLGMSTIAYSRHVLYLERHHRLLKPYKDVPSDCERLVFTTYLVDVASNFDVLQHCVFRSGQTPHQQVSVPMSVCGGVAHLSHSSATS